MTAVSADPGTRPMSQLKGSSQSVEADPSQVMVAPLNDQLMFAWGPVSVEVEPATSSSPPEALESLTSRYCMDWDPPACKETFAQVRLVLLRTLNRLPAAPLSVR